MALTSERHQRGQEQLGIQFCLKIADFDFGVWLSTWDQNFSRLDAQEGKSEMFWTLIH